MGQKIMLMQYGRFNFSPLVKKGDTLLVCIMEPLRYNKGYIYKLWVREYLTSRQGILLRWLIWVFMGEFAEDRQTAGELILLQRQQVAAVQAVHWVSAHTPVEIVHCLSLRKRRDFHQSKFKSRTVSLLSMATHAHLFISRSHAVHIWRTKGASFPYTFNTKLTLMVLNRDVNQFPHYNKPSHEQIKKLDSPWWWVTEQWSSDKWTKI